MQLNNMMIVGNAMETPEEAELKKKAAETEMIDELLGGEDNFNIADNPNDKYRLKFTKELTRKQVLAHYRTPDYCLITRADTLSLLRLELDSLV